MQKKHVFPLPSQNQLQVIFAHEGVHAPQPS
jgi:hypothetical protein